MGRGKYSFTFEFLHNMMGLPAEVQVNAATVDLSRNVITIYLLGDDLPEPGEGAEPADVEITYSNQEEEETEQESE